MLKESITVSELAAVLGQRGWPMIVDVRRAPAFADDPRRIPTALRGLPEDVPVWSKLLPLENPVVVYCVHGHEVSQGAAQRLRTAGRAASFLVGGLAAWLEAGLPTLRSDWPLRPVGSAASRWITRARPKIDRLACPWLIRRFLDPSAEIFYVAAAEVVEEARRRQATPFDIAGVAFSHHGERCSFDAFLERSGLRSTALCRLAEIVRGADTGRHDLAPQAAGLLATSLGLAVLFDDDQALLEAAMPLYDALYLWSDRLFEATHGWAPEVRQ